MTKFKKSKMSSSDKKKVLEAMRRWDKSYQEFEKADEELEQVSKKYPDSELKKIKYESDSK